MKIKVLDGLRGYAALSIIMAHSPLLLGPGMKSLHAFFQDSKLAYLGVDVFFVLSGFLITRILLKEKLEEKFSFKRFYLKRSLRIFPIYYLVIILSGFLFTWNGMGYVSIYWSNYYFSFNLAPHPLRTAWSLAVEEHFYLVWPALLYAFTVKRAKQFIIYGVPIVVVLSLFYTYRYYSDLDAANLVYRGSQFRVLSLAIGSYFAFEEQTIRNLKRKWKGLSLITFIISFSLALNINNTILIHYIPLHAQQLFLFAIASASFFLLVLQFEKRSGIVQSIFSNNLISFIGMISYGIYLYHFPIFYFFGITYNQLSGRAIPLERFLLPIILVFLLPIISYYIFEKPLLKLKDRIGKKEIIHNRQSMHIKA